MSTIVKVPQVAQSTNYPAGSDPWSGMPTKAAIDAGYIANGWIPNQEIDAETENFVKNAVGVALQEVQKEGIFRQVAAGQNAVSYGGLFCWLPFTRLLCIVEYVDSTHQNIVAYSPDLKRKQVTALVTTLDGGAGYPLSSNVGTFINGATAAASFLPIWGGTQGDYLSIVDTSARAQTLVSVTGSSPTDVSDLIGDPITGKLILLRSDRISYGGPAGFTDHVIGGWAGSDISNLSSSPTEVRAWSATKTFATNDGGITISSGVSTLTFNGIALTGANVMMRPTWDIQNSRWLCSVFDPTSDATAANCQTYFSTDGIAWLPLNQPGIAFVALQYFRGWIFGLAYVPDIVGAHGHKGIEIFASNDGGATWMRPGILLTLAQTSGGAPAYINQVRITPMGDAHILFQCSLDTTIAPSSCDYVVLAAGPHY